MRSKANRIPTRLRPVDAREGWYRGVKLQAPATSPKTSLARLQDAVKHAVAKNADALAGGK